jgi:hypothetical protein
MDIATLAMQPALVGRRGVGLRIASVLAALALVLAMFVLVQDRADAAAGGSSAVAASVVSGGDAAQFNNIFCSILLSVRNAFAGTPFGGIVVAIINPLIAAFGCSPS